MLLSDAPQAQLLPCYLHLVSREAGLHKHSEPSAAKQCVATAVPPGQHNRVTQAALHKRLQSNFFFETLSSSQECMGWDGW